VIPAWPASDLVVLDRDHPGFRDPAYRERRNAIARVALEYREGAVPDVEYVEEEHAVWRSVWARLGPLHEAHACREVRDAGAALGLDRARIPQLAALNPTLERATGFRMLPVAGLVTAGTFLGHLGRRVFLTTQYIRHASAPFYTPEPDVVHELVGHAATLVDPELARLSHLLGQAALRTDERGVRALERVYWYTLEFGAVQEYGQPRALGAGLLSSAGELARLTTGEARLLPWDLERMAATAYDPTNYQPHLFVAPSFRRLVDDLEVWSEARFGAPRAGTS
jgi:phenylalanine-4-hydroxylase